MKKVRRVGAKGSLKTAVMSGVEFPNIDLTFLDRGLSEKQKETGMVAQVVVVHPLVLFRCSLFKTESGNYSVNPPKFAINKGAGASTGARLRRGKQASANTGSKEWYEIISLSPSFRNWVVSEFRKREENTEEFQAWYNTYAEENEEKEVVKFSIGGDKFEHEDLDIRSVQLFDDLSEEQVNAGILFKASIETSFGTIKSASVFVHNELDELSIKPQQQSGEDDGLSDAYSFTTLGKAHILSVIHNSLDWDSVEEFEVADKVVEDEEHNTDDLEDVNESGDDDVVEF